MLPEEVLNNFGHLFDDSLRGRCLAKHELAGRASSASRGRKWNPNRPGPGFRQKLKAVLLAFEEDETAALRVQNFAFGLLLKVLNRTPKQPLQRLLGASFVAAFAECTDETLSFDDTEYQVAVFLEFLIHHASKFEPVFDERLSKFLKEVRIMGSGDESGHKRHEVRR